MTKIHLLLFASLLLFSPPSFAQAPREADVERLFAVMHMRARVEIEIPKLFSAKLEFELSLLSTDAARQSCMQQIEREQESLDWEQVRRKLIVYYQKTYTQEEILQLIVFYQTSAGQKSLDLRPLAIASILELDDLDDDEQRDSEIETVNPPDTISIPSSSSPSPSEQTSTSTSRNKSGFREELRGHGQDLKHIVRDMFKSSPGKTVMEILREPADYGSSGSPRRKDDDDDD